ncbi:MAG: hypothetical protein JSU01_23615 [Bacteroidetes bacterium]|nr:hypothetical protein [Bacteroidota bacterium]
MATFKPGAYSYWAIKEEIKPRTPGLWKRFTAFANRQKPRKAFWFFAALTVQGIFFLPLPAFLVYYYNASISVLLITMSCFFTNIIAYMGGAGIRTVILLSALSILIQLLTAVAIIAF